MTIYCSVEPLDFRFKILAARVHNSLTIGSTCATSYVGTAALGCPVERRSTGFCRHKEQSFAPPESRGRQSPRGSWHAVLTEFRGRVFYVSVCESAPRWCVLVLLYSDAGVWVAQQAFPTPTRPKSGGFLFVLILTRS